MDKLDDNLLGELASFLGSHELLACRCEWVRNPGKTVLESLAHHSRVFLGAFSWVFSADS
jgi:hypothetical protein